MLVEIVCGPRKIFPYIKLEMDRNSTSKEYQKEKRRKEELEQKYKKTTDNLNKLKEQYQALLNANCKCQKYVE